MDSPIWVVKPASAQARKAWEKAKKQEPDLIAKEKERLENRPLERGENPTRAHQLRGALATRAVGGVKLDQWQHELTSDGRIWYCVDRKKRIIWVIKVSLSHPNET